MAKSCVLLAHWSRLWSGWPGRLPRRGMAQTWLVLWRLQGSVAMVTAPRARCLPGGPCQPPLQQFPAAAIANPHFLTSSCPHSLWPGWGLNRNKNYVLTIKTDPLSCCLMAMCPPSDAPKPIASWGAKSPGEQDLSENISEEYSDFSHVEIWVD